MKTLELNQMEIVEGGIMISQEYACGGAVALLIMFPNPGTGLLAIGLCLSGDDS